MPTPALSAKTEAKAKPMFVRNAWYVAAYSEDIDRGQLFARTIIGEPIVFFRTAQAKVVAMQDRCAHRRMPLSRGSLTDDDNIVCAYHGLTYNARGTCVHVPGQATAPGIQLRTYPIEERLGLVWIWMGAADSADRSQIFDCSWMERPDWHHTRLYRHAKADYLLLNDNIADLLHVAYLHKPSGAGNEHMGPAETKLELDEFGYHFERQSRNIPSPPAYVRLSNTKGNVDRWHIVDFKAPSFFRVYVGVAETGTGGPESALPEGRGRWTIYPHHFITPETEKTTHYFQVVVHAWPASADSLRLNNAVMDEDVWAIEQQQINIDVWPDAPTISIASDRPMFEMRRIVDRMLRSEAVQAA